MRGVEIVRSVAAAGKHILMEKPAGRTTQDAEEIVAICDDAGVKLGVVFQNRFRAASLTMKDLLDSGKLGELALAFLVVPWWRGQGYYDERGRGTLERDGWRCDDNAGSTFNGFDVVIDRSRGRSRCDRGHNLFAQYGN